MKTEYIKDNLKDNIATAAVLVATAITILGAIVNSTEARADYPLVQKMETIVITAPRGETVKLETIIVTAPRDVKIVVAFR